ncbi:(2Fe-2S)-binding protein [Acrocarpospora pleiomorpha]|uniref:(2Fe-2S)-binding protein n=1 Tax=Acrocarpospora pleiomorpha TaxID=90975 RepID=A0A5M3Y575_9ACTN|nr:aromatic ring-hydroxylating dioxygenase subunit alpha [Acrocarpospora pleiomorpha]GES27433.1 (2Fe-2S)-binding protein [Acrocarpospora pleiomorpha]
MTMMSSDTLPLRAKAEDAMRRSWFPVARSVDLTSPHQATLLGERLSVYRTASGRPVVHQRRCPHRGGDLSAGVVHGEDIACPYHGWRFSADGRCTTVPSLADQSKIPPKCHIKTYPAVERYGHVWTVLGEPICELYDLEEWRELDLEWLAAEPLHQTTGVAVAIENFRDVAHFPFVHQVSMGTTPEVVEPLQVRREGLDVWMDRPLPAVAGDWASQGDAVMRYHCVAPGLASITFNSPTLGRRVVAGFPSPVAYDEVRIFWGVAAEPGFRGDSLEKSLALEEAVYLEDLPIAAGLEPREIPWDGEYQEFSAPADLFTLNYRRSFRELMSRVDRVSVAANGEPR